MNGRSGEMQVTSREVTIHYIYNINYWQVFTSIYHSDCQGVVLCSMLTVLLSRMTNVGALSGVLTTLVERNRGFGAAFPIPLGFLIISTLVFLSCIRRYSK